MSIDWDRLKEPFAPWDVEWRVSRAGKKDGKVWAKVLAYITARAIQERLDEVFGMDGWKNEYREGPNGGVICRIYFRGDDGEWHWKEDGAENTDIEAVKGGLSGALKRAGSVLGVGRYLYNLEEGWANVHEGGERYAKTKDGEGFKWDPPELPAWALPEDAQNGIKAPVTLEVEDALNELAGLNAHRSEAARALYENQTQELIDTIHKAIKAEKKEAVPA